MLGLERNALATVSQILMCGRIVSLRQRPSGCREWLDAVSDLTRFTELHAAHVVTALQVHPELRLHAEEESECVGHFRLDRPPTFDDLIKRRARNARPPRELSLRQSEPFEKFLLQDAPRRGGVNSSLFCGHGDWRVSGNR